MNPHPGGSPPGCEVLNIRLALMAECTEACLSSPPLSVAPLNPLLSSYRQPWFYGWGFNLPRGQALLEKWNLIPEGVDVLITHGPPLGKTHPPMPWAPGPGCLLVLGGRRVWVLGPGGTGPVQGSCRRALF